MDETLELNEHPDPVRSLELVEAANREAIQQMGGQALDTEITVMSMDDQEKERHNQRVADVIRTGDYFAHEKMTAQGREYLPGDISTPERIEERHRKLSEGEYKDDEFMIKFCASNTLEGLGKVQLRMDYWDTTTDEQLKRNAGFIDEDSFDFAWQLMDKFAEIDEAAPALESQAISMMHQFKRFIAVEGNLERVQKDDRLKGVLSMHAAYELAQVGDIEAAEAELETIEQPALKDRLLKSLHEAQEKTPPVTAEQSKANFEQQMQYVDVPNVPADGEKVDTRIVTNRSIRTLNNLFSPFSDGRVVASLYGHDTERMTAPSSGDNDSRQLYEETLGHPRRLFAPRVVYGVLVESDKTAERSDYGWDYGDVRFVLKEDSVAAEHASFTMGDSLNGTPFTDDRILAREDADRFSTVSRQIAERGDQHGLGSTTRYVEAQVDGLHIKDIEEIIIRPKPMTAEDAEALAETAELAAQHGIKVSLVMDFEAIKARNEDMDDIAIAEMINKRIARLSELSPHVQVVVDADPEKQSLFTGNLGQAQNKI